LFPLRLRVVSSFVRPHTRSVSLPSAPQHVFDGKPFRKSTVLAYIAAVAGGGAGVVIFAVVFQNKKHGFT